MFNLWLHIFCFFGLVYFLLFKIIIINTLLSIIPIILCLFLCLLPSPCCIFILIIYIFHVFYFIRRFTELWSWKNLCWLLLYFLCLFYYCVPSKYNRTWTIRFVWFLRTMRIFWFTIVSWSISRRITLSELRIKIFWCWFSIIISNLRELTTHFILSFKSIYYKIFNLKCKL